MTKKTRLRIHKEKRGRRVVNFLLLALLVGIFGYQLDKKFKIVEASKDFYSQVIKTLSPATFTRGTIYDRNLKQLALTMERVSVFVRTREVDSIEETAMLLSTVLQLDTMKFQNQLESGVLRLWVAEDISQEQEVAINNLRLSGIYLQRESKRFYPKRTEAAHLLGYVEGGLGLSGVEYYYDRILASRKLKQQKEQQPLSHAQDLVLTIDLKIQTILEALVKEITLKQNAFKVTAYLQESKSGEIIAGVHFPSFDPNNFTRYSQDVIKNSFLEPIYLPHKFRRFLRDAALLYSKQSKGEYNSAWSLVSPDDDLGIQLQLWSALGFDGDFSPDFTTGTETTINSELPDIQVLSTYLDDYGMTPEIVTPMQLLNVCTILLGNGKIISPNIVKKIIDLESDQEIDFSQVVEQGSNKDQDTVYNFKSLDYLFESQVVYVDSSASYLRDSIVLNKGKAGYTSSYINDLTLVKIPAGSDDLFLLVSVEKKPEQIRKSAESATTIETIIDSKVDRISVLQQIALSVADVVEPEVAEEGNYQGKLRIMPSLDSSESNSHSTGMEISVMPDLVGLSLRKSLRLLHGIPLKLKIEGTGRVVSQTPLPGTSLKGITLCELVLVSREKEMFEEQTPQHGKSK